MDGHVHSVAALAVIDRYIFEVSSKASILCRPDDNATRASAIDCNRACITGEDQRCWTPTDWKRACWLSSAISKGSSDTEAKSEKRSNES